MSNPFSNSITKMLHAQSSHLCHQRVRQWLSLILLAAAPCAHAANLTWSATPTDGNFGNAANWGGTAPGSVTLVSDSLTFGASNTTTLTNNITAAAAGLYLGTVTFNADAPAYTIGGNAIIGSNGGGSPFTSTSFVVNSAPGVTQTINTNFALYQNAVNITGAGDLTFGGTITKGSTWNPFIQMNGTGVLTLTGAGAMNSGGSTNAYIFNSGTVVLAKSGTTTFNVAGLTINGGTTQLGAVDQFKSGGTLTINGGTLDLNGFDSQTLVLTTSTPGLTLNGTGGLITNNAAGSGTNVLYIGAASTTSSYGGTISDGATAKVGVTVYDPGAGSNLAVLSGKNNYSGGTIIRSITTADRAATLSIASVASIGSVGNRNLTFFGITASAETVLQLTGTAVTNSNQFDSLTFTSGKGVGFDIADSANTFILGKNAGGTDIAISGAGLLQKRGAGTLEIDSNLAYTGATRILGGTLKINAQAGGALASTSALGLGGGELYLLGKTSGTTAQTLGAVTLGLPNFNYQGNGASKITVDANGGTGTTLTLGTMVNTTAYGTTLNVKVTTGATVTTTTTSVTNSLLGNGRVVFTDASNVVDFAGISASGANRTIQAATYTSGLPTSTSDLNTNYSHTDNASVTASESVNALKLTTTTTGQALTIDPGQTLTLTSGGLLFTGANDYSITGGTLKSNSATTSDLLIHQYGAGKLTIDSVITNGNGNSALTKAGTGTLTLTGANTYTGLTLVTGGTLSISSDSNIGGTNGTFAGLTSATNSTSVTSTAAALPTGFVVGSTFLGRTVTAIAGSSGAYTITLNGNANTALSGGTASWAFTGVTDFNYDSANLYLNSGGVLQATSTFSLQEVNAGGTAGTTTANRRVTIGTGGGDFDVTGANVLTVPGVINATGMMTKSGTGTLVLAGSNSITAGLTINDGTVQQGNANALGNVATSNLIFGSGTTAKFQLNNFDARVTSLVSSNTNAIVENGTAGGARTLTVYNGADNTFAGILRNGGASALALTKTGAGTLTLSNAGNTFSGGTTIYNGTLYGTQTGSLGIGTITLANGTLKAAGSFSNAITDLAGVSGAATSYLNNSIDTSAGSASFSGIFSGAGALAKTGANTLTLGNSANTYTGALTVSGGNLVIGSAGSVASVTVAPTTNLTYAAAGDNPLAVTGNLAITTVGGVGSTVLGTSIGTTATKAQINVTGNATIDSATVTVDIYGVPGVTHFNGLTTLVHGGASSTLNNATYTLGTVYNNTDFTVGALTKSATDLQVTTTTATALTAAFWKGGLSGNTNVWAASNGSTASNWTTTAGGSVQALIPGTGADVTISATSPATAPSATALGADMSIKSLTISDTTNGLGLNSDGHTLTIATGGITRSANVPASFIAANVTLGAAQTWTNNSTNGTLTVNGDVSGAFTLAVAGAGNTTMGGIIKSGVGLITKSGVGTLTLRGANTFASGLTIGNGGGAVQIDTLGAQGSGTITLSKQGLSTGTLKLNTSGANVYANTFASMFSSGGTMIGGAPNIQNAQGDNTISSNLTINNSGGMGVTLQTDSGTLRLTGILSNTVSGLRPFEFAGAGNGIFSGVMSQTTGTTGILKNGIGTWSVTGTNSTFTGAVSVLQGVLNVASVANTGSNSSIGASGAINLTGQGTSGTLQYTGSTAQTTDHALTIAATGGTLDASGTGSGTLKFTGTFTATDPAGFSLNMTNGSNVVTNTTQTLPGTVGGNVMSITTAAGLAPGTTITSINGNQYTLSNNFTGTTGSIAATFGASVARTLTLTGSNTGNNEIASTLANSVGGGLLSISKTGNGTWTLTGPNTYTGTTTINAGTLSLSGSGSLSDLTAVVVNSPGAFDISGISTSEKIASLSADSGSTLKLGAKTLEFGDATDTSFAGSVDSDTGGALKKVGSGKFTLTASGYTGTGPNINISLGTLLTGAGNLPSSTAFTLSGGSLNTGTFSNTVGSLSVTSGSVIDFAGGGTPVLTFASQGTWTGLLQIWNWSGSVWSSGTGGQLRFADGIGGTLIDASKVQFYSGAGTGLIGEGGGFIGTELVPVPEPSTLISGTLLWVMVGLGSRRMAMSRRRSAEQTV